MAAVVRKRKFVCNSRWEEFGAALAAPSPLKEPENTLEHHGQLGIRWYSPRKEERDKR